MGLSSCFFSFIPLVFWLSLLHLIVLAHSTSSVKPLCHEDEHSSLLQFNESLTISKYASSDPSAYPKVSAWKADVDCCSWDGVTCNGVTGHLTGLDLTSSFLYGNINSSSTLFQLVHLEWLSLADNDFNGSKIPSEIINLSRLSHLDLYDSNFSGQIPSEVLELSKLEILDTTFNSNLKLQKPGLRSLVEKLTQLKELRLGGINISSSVPDTLANLSSLTFLSLKGCYLQGEFPEKIFQLPNLRVLSVRFNSDLSGFLPEFENNSSIEELRASNTGFSGNIPYSIGNLNSLQILDISNCSFFGSIPPSLGNLTKITFLHLYLNDFSGEFTSIIGNLSSLEDLDLGSNHLSGQVDMDMLSHKLKNLSSLSFFSNNLSLVSRTNRSTKFPKLRKLSLGALNLTEFPNFLQNQDQLTDLDLSLNKLVGRIPRWFLNLSVDSLQNLNLAHNLLTGFD